MHIADLVGEAPGESGLSCVAGIPLADEPGIGSQTIGGYLRETVARYGRAEAVVLNTGGERIAWSYDELWDRSVAVARALVATGLGKGERVGILMTNRPEFLSALFGTALAGGVTVALSTFSTQEELGGLVAASEVSTLLFEERVLKKDLRTMLAALEPAIRHGAPGQLASTRFPYLRRLVAVGGVPGDEFEPANEGTVETWQSFLSHGHSIETAQVDARAAGVSPADPGGVFFSSGTTSLPKGIAHDQRSFAIQWWRWPRVFAIREPARSWTGNGFFWSGNVSMVVGCALSSGGCVVLQRLFEADEALRLIEEEHVAFANGRPHQWARLQASDRWAEADLSSLRYVPRGELLYEHPTITTDWRVPMSFGTTETMSICTALTADYSEATYQGSFGVPLPGNVLKIVDPATGQLTPVGQPGEICVKGPTLMSRYLGKAPEQCFDAEGFYCTGDGGRVDGEGRVYWDGRLTDMIKTGGANVAPEEIDALVGNWPGVKRAQTVGVPDALLSEKVVTCVIPLEGEVIDSCALIEHLKGKLASFKVPKQILICTDEDFALTGNEKVKTSDIRAMATRKLDAG